MEELLKNIQLSDKAIELYIRCIGQQPLSSFELYSIFPNISQEDFSNTIKELVEAGLFVPVHLQDPQILLKYLALPPINPIINYYSNINASLDNIKNQIQIVISNSLSSIFEKNKIVELDTMVEATQALRKDIEEDVIIQKQDIDDIVKGMENLKDVKKVLENLRQSIKGITQTQFSYLIKMITNIKSDIFTKVESLDLKKTENVVKNAIEEVFKENFNKFLGDFTAKLHKLIEEEFENTIKSLNNIIDSTFQFRNDFQMVLLNMLNSYEQKINTIIELIKSKRDILDDDLKKFESVISDNFKEIIYDSVNSVTALNNPINLALESYLTLLDSLEENDFWQIKSISRVNEEIMHIISLSKQNLMIIVPKLEDHIVLDDFKSIPKSLKIEIASSEPHTNSNVKKLKELTNFEYRSLKNDNLIICKSNDDHFLMGIIKEDSQNSLQDFIGFTTSNKALIKLFLNVINPVWDTASTSLHEAPRSIGFSSPKEIKTKLTSPVTSAKFKAPPPKTPFMEQSVDMKYETSADVKITEKFQKTIEKPLEKVDSMPTPPIPEVSIKTEEDSSILIKNAFKDLIQKLQNLKGEEFSKELERIADLILEKKGFSVTLHKIRSKINQYKTHLGHLNDVDINHIIESIEEWKKHIL